MLGVVTVDPVAHRPDPASRAPTLARWQGTTHPYQQGGPMPSPKTGRRAGVWPGPHNEAWRATLRGLARRTPTHRKEEQ